MGTPPAQWREAGSGGGVMGATGIAAKGISRGFLFALALLRWRDGEHGPQGRQGVHGTLASVNLHERRRSTMRIEFDGRNLIAWFVSGVFLALGACGDGSDTPQAALPVVDLSGVWAGTWQGTDPTVPGQVVTGNWEGVITQTQSTAAGTATLFGDVDCMEGTLLGSPGVNNVVSGTYTRSPCGVNNWTLTAVNLSDGSASGLWTQPSSGAQGAFTGSQIARPGGPRILFANPSGGLPGTVVTIVGMDFSAVAAENVVDFNRTAAAPLLTSDPETLTVQVPVGATTGPLDLAAPKGTANSPRLFNMDVTFPAPTNTAAIAVGRQPEGVAISLDGRKAYVANKLDGSVSLIDTSAKQIILTNPNLAPAVQGVVASPDGRRVYVAAGASGILVLDAALIQQVDLIPVDAGGGTQANPQGLALSPDGRRLYVTQNAPGGALSVVDIATKAATSINVSSTEMPLGVAASPDGRRVYLAVSDTTLSGADTVRILDPLTLVSAAASFPVGSRPVGIAVTPDAGRVYISNQLGNSVSAYDATAGQIVTIPVGLAPVAVAISPDGSRVYVPNGASNTVSVISTGTNQIVATFPVPAGSGPTVFAISPDGKFAYVANATGNSAGEIGGQMTLTV